MNTEFFTTKQAANYLGISEMCLRKMCMKREVPYFKSKGGKLNYFLQGDLDKWALAYRVGSKEDLDARVDKALKNKA